jgi:hypothetical protein
MYVCIYVCMYVVLVTFVVTRSRDLDDVNFLDKLAYLLAYLLTYLHTQWYQDPPSDRTNSPTHTAIPMN